MSEKDIPENMAEKVLQTAMTGLKKRIGSLEKKKKGLQDEIDKLDKTIEPLNLKLKNLKESINKLKISK